MAVKIGHAVGDENGKAHGGKAGDQTKREVLVGNWYADSWHTVLRCKDPAKREVMAQSCEKACVNNNIGYDQYQRNTLREAARAAGFDLNKVEKKCECDCSSLMTVCAESAGIEVPYNSGNAPATSNMVSAFKSTGEFEVLTDSKYLKSDELLLRGDILVKKGHTLMILEDGAGAAKAKLLGVGTVVDFTGTKQYKNSTSFAKAVAAGKCQAKITAVNEKGAHPYHLVSEGDFGKKVYGWVDREDVKIADDYVEAEIRVGDFVRYSGTVHYTSSYAGAKAKPCSGGIAKVTDIKKGNPHPYHLVHTGAGCTVCGWGDEDKVVKN